jgi:NAD(P)-dependent dehydrogenase (short-subunit alcohol dehydrogenase family)
MSFENQVVFITGAASGFGLGLAKALEGLEASLYLSDINQEGLKERISQLQTPSKHDFQKLDVSIEDEVANAIKNCIDKFGRIDILVNNAGVGGTLKPIIDITEEDMDRYFAINTKSVLFGMKHAIPTMIKQGKGCILNVASMAGILGAPTIGAYAASKHAVVGLTKTAALEYAKYGIRVNAICPYFVPTPLVQALADKDKLASLGKACPMGRMGEVEEIVSAMIGIIHPYNSYMNGQCIQVDGGIGAG